MKSVRFNIVLPQALHEKLRKEAYVKRIPKAVIIRVALDEHFNKK